MDTRILLILFGSAEAARGPRQGGFSPLSAAEAIVIAEKRPLMTGAERLGTAFLDFRQPAQRDPQAIIADILGGITQPPGSRWRVDAGGHRSGLAAAEPGDIVLILGKGHESGQEIADRVIPFDDRKGRGIPWWGWASVRSPRGGDE